MSRFPKLTETFVLFEMLALQRQGARVEVYPLLRARNTGTHPEAAGIGKKLFELLRRPDEKPVMHPEAEPFVQRAHFMPFFNLAIARAQWHFALWRPEAYFGALWTLIRANWGSANFLLGGLAIFPKAVYFARAMQRQKIGHVHAHFANHPAAAAYIIHRLTGIPYSFTAHGADLQVDQHMLREKVAAAKYVITISQDNGRLIEQVCGRQLAERVRLVRCGVDTSIFHYGSREADASSSPALHIVCIGTLYEVKGQTHLIEACRILSERNVPVRCDLVGDGPLLEQLQQQVQSADLAGTVHFLGRRTRQEIAGLLQNADVLVAPSVPTAEGRREGIPVVLMEGQGSGLPVVASNISGIPELVEHEKTGLLVPPADPAALADALARLAADPQQRRALGRAGRAKILDEFDLHKNAGRLLELFCAEVTS
jgi:glycosyltransferase involved in cell wall biosynthesis